MSSRCRSLCLLLLAGPLAMPLAGCDREQREFPGPDAGRLSQSAVRQSPLEPGAPKPRQADLPANYWEKYERNAYALAQGKRLFRWYNCNGCHAQGGGGMGPALMDDQWLYGGEPAQVHATIRDGRPNGMPSFGGHISDEQIWQLVAYVRSMSGQVRADAAPSRSDSLQPYEPETRREREEMRQAPPKRPPQ